MIAKASLRFYILTEISQFALLTAFSHEAMPALARLARHGRIWPLILFISPFVVASFYSGVSGHDSTDTCTGIGYPAS